MKITYKYFNINPETKVNQKTYKSNQYMKMTAKWFVMQFSKTANNSCSSCEQNKSSFTQHLHVETETGKFSLS